MADAGGHAQGAAPHGVSEGLPEQGQDRGGATRQDPVTHAFAASGGYVWLRGFPTSEEVTWTRHSLRGEPAVRITLPRRDVIKDAAHDWLWIVRKDELDVPRLVKLKVEG